MVEDGFVHGKWSMMDLHIGDSLLIGCLTSIRCLLGNLPNGIGIIFTTWVTSLMMATWTRLLAKRTTYNRGVFCILEEGINPKQHGVAWIPIWRLGVASRMLRLQQSSCRESGPVIPHFVAHMVYQFLLYYAYICLIASSSITILLHIPWWWALVTCHSSVYMVYDVIYHWWWMRLFYGCLHLISLQIDTHICSFIFMIWWCTYWD